MMRCCATECRRSACCAKRCSRTGRRGMKCSERLSIMKALCQQWPVLMAGAFMLAGSLNTPGAEDEPVTPTPSVTAPRMDYGSMLTYTVGLPSAAGKTNENLALKGVCIRLGGSNEAAVCFDTDLLHYYAGWTGGFLDISKTHLTS